jgi:cytochrome c oxidase assembly protein subunit 16
MSFSSLISRIQRNKHFKYGLPFFAFIFGGKLVLEEFRSVRYDPVLNPRGNHKLLKPEEIFAEIEKETGKKIYNPKKKTDEEELALYEKKYDLDNWENKRGPRPWEEGSIPNRPLKRVKREPATVKELLGE